MTQDAQDQARRVGEEFASYLHQSRAETMDYALDHAQMESWIALEALHFFTERCESDRGGWRSWETIAFVTDEPVRAPTRGKPGIKFPDLVCWSEQLKTVLWWEFKAIGRRALHPSGGTIAKDVRALRAFDQHKTGIYMDEHRLPGVRENSDDVAILASGLTGDVIRKCQHIGIVMLFVPPEQECAAANRGRRDGKATRAANARASTPWKPADIVAKLNTSIHEIDGVVPPSTGSDQELWVAPSATAGGLPRGGVKGDPARSFAWLVRMGN